MEELIRQKLAVLKSIEPSAEFLTRSRATILTSVQEAPLQGGLRFRLFEGFRFAGALTLASVLLIVLISSAHGPSSNVTALNNSALNGEAAQVSSEFKLHIDEANYYGESAARVASALDEISRPANTNTTIH